MIHRAPSGRRCGTSHYKAKLTDAQVREMRMLHESGKGYLTLAKAFSCGVSTARDICTYRTRVSA